MLSAVYIKGFKTFARPVRMPLEGGLTAIVGPNGSGKSNITDAVLFAFGEQSPGVLRAGAMGDLIFSGSETLPASSVAEVTLVLDNESGEISLPYQEVSISRRISRGGDTEYRINGSRSRLADVRAVAGEAGLGRHSILRQGAVDAIVAGGATACRLALEEAAGLGVYRRRRLSSSRRLEKAEAQLEQSRQLEAELAAQLRRIEREAVAAREYREVEARYRKLSLAHLYRVADQGLDERRRQLEKSERSVAQLSAQEASLREEEASISPEAVRLESTLRTLEHRLEALEEAEEDLRTETMRADRTLFRVEARAGGEGDRQRNTARLRAELERIESALKTMQRELDLLNADHARKREQREELRRTLTRDRERQAETDKSRSRLSSELETLRGRHERVRARGATSGAVREDHLANLESIVDELESLFRGSSTSAGRELQDQLDGLRAAMEKRAAEISRRGGVLEAALGRTEAGIRALQDSDQRNGSGPRLHEVIRAKPGFEGAVEAALGDAAAGLLAENLSEGMKLLSDTEPVALRLDARPLVHDEVHPGIRLLDCVELVNEEYAEAVESLLGGIYVVEDPARDHPQNGHVVVTRNGLRLTRTSVRRRADEGRFSRQARLGKERERLRMLKDGPGELLYDCREQLSAAGQKLELVVNLTQTNLSLAARTQRTCSALLREARSRNALMERRRETLLQNEREIDEIRNGLARVEASLAAADEAAQQARRDAATSAASYEEAEAALAQLDRRKNGLRAAVSEGRQRRDNIAEQLGHLEETPGDGLDLPARLAARVVEISQALSPAARERRGRLRRARSEAEDEHRQLSQARADLSRRAVDLARDLATARADAEHARQDLLQAENASSEALEEIRDEWSTTLEDARREADAHGPETEAERHRLARKLKRFGDVNLLALSQQETLRERHEFVSAQRADAEAAANELGRIIQLIDAEIEQRFTETFGRVRRAFREMVPRMMEGAAGVLDLSEEGVEIGLRLGRKGWRPLHVLSGGERALLALSFLFSIFLSRPGREGGAFCILDEAEAALDDLNLARFIAVVDSYRSEGQFLLVTHQKRTMAAADVLYGVVQDAAGATTVVSKRMQGE